MKIKKTLLKTWNNFEQKEKLFISFAFFLGLVLTIVVPPFQKPDEIVHFYKTASVAKGRLVCPKDESGVFKNQLPKYIVDFPLLTYAEHIAFKPQISFPKNTYLQLISLKDYDKSLVQEISACPLPFWPYLPSAFVISLPLALKLNPLLIFYLGRLSNFLFAFTLSVLAILITKKQLRIPLLLILCLPMTLYQFGSYSKDALHIAFGLLAFAYLWKLLEQKSKILKKDLFIFFISIGLVILSRPQYFLYSGLVLILGSKNKKRILNNQQKLGIVFIASLMLLISFALSREIYSANVTSLGNQVQQSYIHPELQLSLLIENPGNFLQVINKTLQDDAQYLIREMIGVLGWLDTDLDWYIYPLFIGFIFIAADRSKDNFTKLSNRQLTVLSLIGLGTFMAIFLAMYLYATPVAGEKVIGLQGRYFLLLIPIFFWTIAEFLRRMKKNSLQIVLALILISVSGTLVRRYYNSHNYFYNPRIEIQNNYMLDKVTDDISGTQIKIFEKQNIQVDKDKKLAGISVLVKSETYLPYQFEVRDRNCDKVLRKKIVDSSGLEKFQWYDVTFASIKIEDDQVCVQILPYKTKIVEIEPLELVNYNKNSGMMIHPLYLF